MALFHHISKANMESDIWDRLNDKINMLWELTKELSHCCPKKSNEADVFFYDIVKEGSFPIAFVYSPCFDIYDFEIEEKCKMLKELQNKLLLKYSEFGIQKENKSSSEHYLSRIRSQIDEIDADFFEISRIGKVIKEEEANNQYHLMFYDNEVKRYSKILEKSISNLEEVKSLCNECKTEIHQQVEQGDDLRNGVKETTEELQAIRTMLNEISKEIEEHKECLVSLQSNNAILESIYGSLCIQCTEYQKTLDTLEKDFSIHNTLLELYNSNEKQILMKNNIQDVTNQKLIEAMELNSDCRIQVKSFLVDIESYQYEMKRYKETINRLENHFAKSVSSVRKQIVDYYTPIEESINKRIIDENIRKKAIENEVFLLKSQINTLLAKNSKVPAVVGLVESIQFIEGFECKMVDLFAGIQKEISIIKNYKKSIDDNKLESITNQDSVTYCYNLEQQLSKYRNTLNEFLDKNGCLVKKNEELKKRIDFMNRRSKNELNQLMEKKTIEIRQLQNTYQSIRMANETEYEEIDLNIAKYKENVNDYKVQSKEDTINGNETKINYLQQVQSFDNNTAVLKAFLKTTKDEMNELTRKYAEEESESRVFKIQIERKTMQINQTQKDILQLQVLGLSRETELQQDKSKKKRLKERIKYIERKISQLG